MNPSHSTPVSPSSDAATHAEAAQWQVRRQDGLTAEEEAQFQAWLALGAGRQAAYARFDSVWNGLGELPTQAVARLTAALPPAPSVRADRPRGWLSGGSGLAWPMATAVLAITVAGGGWLGFNHWQAQPVYTETFSTARGQQLNVELPDGSMLGLDTATRAEVTLYRDRREVRLPEGQALFAVKADAARPFHVLTERMKVTVVGTRFSVRNTRTGLAQNVGVQVEEGRVRVTRLDHGNPAGTPLLLTAGQYVQSDAAGRLAATQPAPAGAMPWREGRVNFERTPLAQAVAEFARYGATGLVIKDPAVAALRVNGSFDLRQAGAFSQTLPLVLPVQLRAHGGETEIIAKSSK